MRLQKFAPLALSLLTLAQTAAAETQGVLSVGAAEDARQGQLGVQLALHPGWLRSEKLNIVAELSLGYWRGRSDSHVNNSLIDLALIPALRFHPYGAAAGGPFVEGGIGVHLLSRTRIHDDRRFGSAFQFGDMAGVGWQFGGAGRYELGLRLHHVSNGGIKEPNQGINFVQLRFVVPL